jgi:hypothetical protein
LPLAGGEAAERAGGDAGHAIETTDRAQQASQARIERLAAELQALGMEPSK